MAASIAGGGLDAPGGAAGPFESAELCELPSCLGGAEFVVSFDLVVWTGSRLETSFFPLWSESWLSDSSSVSFVLPLESLSAPLLPSLSRSPRSLVPALSLPGPAVVVPVGPAVMAAAVVVGATIEVTAAVVDAVVAEVTPVEVACVVVVVAAVAT